MTVFFSSSNIVLVLLSSWLSSVTVDSCSLQRQTLASASIQHSRQSRIRQRRCSVPLSTPNPRRRRGLGLASRDAEVLLVARRSRTTTQRNDEVECAPTANSPSSSEISEPSYKDLSLTGKIIAGVVQVAVVTVFDFFIGFCGGYALGSVWGLPGIVLGKNENFSDSILKAASRRLVKMHQ